MTQTSRVWDGLVTGDAVVAPYDAATEFSKVLMSIAGAAGIPTNLSGVFRNELNELATTGVATPVSTNSGRAMVWGTWYESDAAVTTAIPTPSAATRIDRIVLRKDWAAQTVRITRIAGVEGGGAPALTQVAATTWDQPIAQVSITTGGVITVTDQRQFLGGSSLLDNIDTVAVGDLLYADTTTTLARLADVATGSILVSGGIGAAPAWSATPTISGLVTLNGNALVSKATTPNIALNFTTTSSYGNFTMQENGVEKVQINLIGSTFGTTARRGWLELINETAAGGISLWTNTTQQLSIDSVGSVGINSTPHVWFTAWRGLEINGGAGALFSSASTGAGTSGIAQNYYVDASGNEKFVYNGYAQRIAMSAGVFYMQGTSSSGTAGNTATMNTWLQMDSAGRMGIGGVPNGYGLLDLQSTLYTLIIPRMTTTQKNAMTALNGMIVYDSTLNKFQGYENGAWNNFSVL